MMCYSVSDTGILGKKDIRVLLSGVEPTGDSWELRAKAIKLDSWDKHSAQVARI